MTNPLIVMITAAASGIGRTVAEAFSAAGHRVFISDADAKAVEDMAVKNPAISASRVDVTAPAEIEAWFAAVKAEAGGLDVLINNAGIAGPTARLEEIDVEKWRQCIDVCLNSQFLTSRCAIPLMKDANTPAASRSSALSNQRRSPTSASSCPPPPPA